MDFFKDRANWKAAERYYVEMLISENIPTVQSDGMFRDGFRNSYGRSKELLKASAKRNRVAFYEIGFKALQQFVSDVTKEFLNADDSTDKYKKSLANARIYHIGTPSYLGSALGHLFAALQYGVATEESVLQTDFRSYKSALDLCKLISIKLRKVHPKAQQYEFSRRILSMENPHSPETIQQFAHSF